MKFTLTILRKLQKEIPFTPGCDKTWYSNGEIIPIKDMTTNHILNAIKYCEGQAAFQNKYNYWINVFMFELKRRSSYDIDTNYDAREIITNILGIHTKYVKKRELLEDDLIKILFKNK